MKTQTLRVSLAYSRLPDANLVDFTETVEMDLYPNASFPSPPVTQVDLKAAKDAFASALAAMAQGGPSSTSAKNDRRDTLQGLLKQLAFYVEVTSNNNLTILLSSGFKDVSNNRNQEQLPAPSIVYTKNGLSNQSLTTVTAVKNSRSYQLQYALVDEAGSPGEWINAKQTTSSRNIPVNDLLSGRVYIYRVRAIGGLTGQSDWSASLSHKAY